MTLVYEDIISSAVGCNGEFNKSHQQDLGSVNPSSAGTRLSGLAHAALVGMGWGATRQQCPARTETGIPTSIPPPHQHAASCTPGVSRGLVVCRKGLVFACGFTLGNTPSCTRSAGPWPQMPWQRWEDSLSLLRLCYYY